MTTLVLPVAGRSSRFPGMRPKWLLTMPSGQLMVEASVQGLPLEDFDRIVLIALHEHIESYVDINRLKHSLSETVRADIEVIVLPEATGSPAETVVRGCDEASVEGAIFIKDCDNYFSSQSTGSNQICTLDLAQAKLIDASGKSFIQRDARGEICNIVEKRVVSDTFCTGGYGFEDYSLFREQFYKIKPLTESEIFISDIIFSLMSSGVRFIETPVSDYIDWGTLREYRHYCKRHMTLFCDLDGVLFKNGSKFGPAGWSYEPILDNLESLVASSNAGALHLIITTSRPASERDNILQHLRNFGIVPKEVICGLPHQKRVLVNDFSNTNPYPTAIALNLKRDSSDLVEQIEHLTW